MYRVTLVFALATLCFLGCQKEADSSQATSDAEVSDDATALNDGGTANLDGGTSVADGMIVQPDSGSTDICGGESVIDYLAASRATDDDGFIVDGE